MKQLDLANRFREHLASHSLEVEAAASAQHLDIAHVSENLIAGLLKSLLGLHHVRNRNVEEKTNYPGIDLVDDVAKVGVQVTATPTLDKVKATLRTCAKHGLSSRINRLIIYVLTRRQESYSQSAIDKLGAGITFNVKDDILDFRDLASMAGKVDPLRLSAAVEVIEAFLRGAPSGLAEAEFDPPDRPKEEVSLNLLELYVPRNVYVADLLDLAVTSGRRRQGQRQLLRQHANDKGIRIPSDYMVHDGKLITFHSLDDPGHPFEKLIDVGTVTPLESTEFCNVDVDHERVFKGLLRFTMQQKLHKHAVRWFNEESLFAFLPKENPDIRLESWTGKVRATRTVFVRKLNKKDPAKVLVSKHFAFAVDFINTVDGWYVAVDPDWYFSYGDDFKRSLFADKSLAWLKRKETNRIVFDHFRFLSEWLRDLDQADLFNETSGSAPTVTFGNPVTLPNHPCLDDDSWLPVRGTALDDDPDEIARLFDET